MSCRKQGTPTPPSPVQRWYLEMLLRTTGHHHERIGEVADLQFRMQRRMRTSWQLQVMRGCKAVRCLVGMPSDKPVRCLVGMPSASKNS